MTPALVFDCDGVLADTERDGYLPAFNATFAELGLPVRWSVEEYGRLLAIGGGKERLATLFTPENVAAYGLPTDPDRQKALIARMALAHDEAILFQRRQHSRQRRRMDAAARRQLGDRVAEILEHMKPANAIEPAKR